MNYDLLMNQEISSLTEPKTLLLHACCAPCSSVCLKRLGQYFKITILFYNPNITEEEEYLKRLTEIKRFIIGEDISKSSPVKFLNSDFKKHNGYKESIELSKKYNLYRQNYCGCIYSKRASDIKKESA